MGGFLEKALDSVGSIIDGVLGGGERTAPTVDMGPIAQANTLLSEQIAGMTARNEELAKEAAARQAALDASIAETKKPLEMPSPTSGDVRTAKRKAMASLTRRGGRASTILSDETLGG